VLYCRVLQTSRHCRCAKAPKQNRPLMKRAGSIHTCYFCNNARGTRCTTDMFCVAVLPCATDFGALQMLEARYAAYKACCTAMCYRLWGIANARSKIRRLQSVLVVCTPVIYVITLVARKARLNMITNCCDSICTVCDAQSGSQSMHEARDVRCTHAAPDGCPMQDCNAPVRAFDVSITWTFQLHARL
jgi:hypothetical protein